MSNSLVLYEVRGPLAFVTLNRPEKLNAINGDVINAIHAAMDLAEADETVRVIILRGAGRAFSAGFDLEEEYQDNGEGNAVAMEIKRDFDMIMRFWDSPKPTVAAVHGMCLGGSFEMVLACDLAVAADDARMGEPEVKFGAGVVAMLLPWVCGARKATEILLCGEDRLNAASALEYGIVNSTCPADELETNVVELALRIARNDTRAVQLARAAIKQGYDRSGLREALRDGVERCIEAEGNPSEESRQFHAIIRTQGTRAAATWLDEKLNITELTG